MVYNTTVITRIILYWPGFGIGLVVVKRDIYDQRYLFKIIYEYSNVRDSLIEMNVIYPNSVQSLIDVLKFYDEFYSTVKITTNCIWMQRLGIYLHF